MHRDTKLGLALGMLVIGFTVAFCFPRVTPSIHRPVTEQVKSDPALEFLPIRAYEIPAPIDAGVTAAENGTKKVELVPVVGVFGEAKPEPGESTLASDPSLSKSVPNGTQSVGTTLPADVPETHTVQPGDTLSGIATQYLGSSRRYYEIFEANQDILSTPDALKIGMVLRIPGQGGFEEPNIDSQPMLAETKGTPESQITVPSPYEKEENSRRYHVQPGDTLESISLRHYGTKDVIPRIKQANPEVSTSHLLKIGSILELPEIR